MVYILFGENDFLIKGELEKIKIEFETALPANFISLDGKKLSPSELEGVINAVPFLSPFRLIVVYQLLERFEQGEAFEPWLKVIRGKPESSILVLISGRLSRENPALTSLGLSAQIKEFNMLRGVELESWLRKMINKLGAKITPGAIKLLIRLVGEDQWKLSGEVEKLSLYAQGGIIGEKDVAELVSPASEISILRLIDGWIEGEAKGEELHRLLDRGERPAHIIALLTRQLGLIARAKGMLAQGLSRKEIKKRLAIGDFPLEKTLKQSRRLTDQRLQEIYSLLLEIDLAIKTGRFPEEIAVDILQAQLLSPKPA